MYHIPSLYQAISKSAVFAFFVIHSIYLMCFGLFLVLLVKHTIYFTTNTCLNHSEHEIKYFDNECKNWSILI